MDQVLRISIYYLIGISILLILNELSYRKWKYKGEYSRKTAHVLATLATAPFPFIFDNHWYILGLALLFGIVLWGSRRIKQLDSIHDVSRPSYGSFLLPAGIYLSFLIYSFSGNPVIYLIPIIVLALCDPLAAIVGMYFRENNVTLSLPGRNGNKTLFGSLAFYVSSTIICGLILHLSGLNLNQVVLISPLVGFLGTLGELFSWRGSDNLSIPLSVQIGLLMLL